MSAVGPVDLSQFETFPVCIVVFCDECGVEARRDYLVHDLMTREQRLGVARHHMNRNEGWSCTPDGDFCQDCKPGGLVMSTASKAGTGPVLYLDVDGVVNLGWFTSPDRFGELRAAPGGVPVTRPGTGSSLTGS